MGGGDLGRGLGAARTAGVEKHSLDTKSAEVDGSRRGCREGLVSGSATIGVKEHSFGGRGLG